MKTVGQILHAARLRRKVDLEDVARITKIRSVFLGRIESDDYRSLPSGIVARGFIRNYSEFLGLDPDHVLAVFRRDFVENPAGQIVPRGIADPVSRPAFWTPKTTVIAAVALIFTLFGTYLFYQYRQLTGPPDLVLTSPLPDAEISAPTVEIVGRTDPEATLVVNDQPIILEKGGAFSLRLPLNSGPNLISVTATSKSGKKSIITRTVHGNE